MHVVRQETGSENERGNSGAHVTTDGMAEKYVFPLHTREQSTLIQLNMIHLSNRRDKGKG